MERVGRQAKNRLGGEKEEISCGDGWMDKGLMSGLANLVARNTGTTKAEMQRLQARTRETSRRLLIKWQL